MLRFVFAAVMAGVLAGSAWAADGKADPNAGQRAGGPEGNYSYAKNDRVLKCLGLTEEQITKIDALFKDMQTAQRDLWKGLQGQGGIANPNGAPGNSAAPSKADMAAIQEKSKALMDAFKTKLKDVLTADQRAKYEAADKIISDSQKALQEIYPKFAGAKTADDRKALQDAIAKINKDREDALLKLLGEAYKAAVPGTASGLQNTR